MSIGEEASFYCINCQQDIKYTSLGGKPVMELMDAYSVHNETCTDLSANLEKGDKAQFIADRVIKLVDRMEREKEKK